MTQQTFNAIGLIGKQNDPRVGEALDTLSHFLLEQGLSVYLDEVNADAVTNSALEVCTRNEIGKRCDLAIVVGGDGTPGLQGGTGSDGNHGWLFKPTDHTNLIDQMIKTNHITVFNPRC